MFSAGGSEEKEENRRNSQGPDSDMIEQIGPNGSDSGLHSNLD
jgi:hypothetical protein